MKHIQWYQRHPVVRLLLGYLLHIPSLLGLGYLISFLLGTKAKHFISFFFVETIGIAASIYIFSGIFIGTFIALFCYERLQAKTETIKFDSTPTGKRISETINAICKKNNLSIPWRALSSEKSDYWAHARSWPAPELITISEDLYEKYKDNIVSQKELDKVIGHELGHLYYKHSIVNGLGLNIFFSFVMLCCFIVFAFQCINIGLSAYLFSKSMNEILIAWGAAYILKHTSEISDMIISRACESQAELAACEFVSPKTIYKINLEYSHREQALCDFHRHQLIDKSESRKTACLNYYKSWCKSHPTSKENAEDIALYYPNVKQKTSKTN